MIMLSFLYWVYSVVVMEEEIGRQGFIQLLICRGGGGGGGGGTTCVSGCIKIMTALGRVCQKVS
jgi:hypothetical protein